MVPLQPSGFHPCFHLTVTICCEFQQSSFAETLSELPWLWQTFSPGVSVSNACPWLASTWQHRSEQRPFSPAPVTGACCTLLPHCTRASCPYRLQPPLVHRLLPLTPWGCQQKHFAWLAPPAGRRAARWASAPAVVSPPQQILVTVIVSDAQTPETVWSSPINATQSSLFHPLCCHREYVCLVLCFPVLISSNQIHTGLNEIKPSRTKARCYPSTTGFQYWKPKTICSPHPKHNNQHQSSLSGNEHPD